MAEVNESFKGNLVKNEDTRSVSGVVADLTSSSLVSLRSVSTYPFLDNATVLYSRVVLPAAMSSLLVGWRKFTKTTLFLRKTV